MAKTAFYAYTHILIHGKDCLQYIHSYAQHSNAEAEADANEVAKAKADADEDADAEISARTEVQGVEDALDAIRCRSLSAKEPLIVGLFCGK